MKVHIYLSLFLITALFQSSFAATFTAIADGNWGDSTTWDQGGLTPGPTDTVVISGYTVLLGDYTGDVTVEAIILHNLTGINAANLFIYENVTVNVNTITMNAENDFEDVELQIYGQAVVNISDNFKLDRSSDNNKMRKLFFYLYGNAIVTVGNDFEYNYLNSHGNELQEEIRVEGSAQLNLNGSLVLNKVDGGGEFNMILAGGADVNVTGKFNVFQQNGGDFIVSIQDSSTLTIGDTTTLQNSGGINQLKIDISQIDGFVQFTNEVYFDSNTDDNLVNMHAYGKSRLRFNNNLKMAGNTEGDIGLTLGDTATLEIAGQFLRPDKFGFIQANGESMITFGGTGTPAIEYSNLTGSGGDSVYINKITLNNTSGAPLVLESDLVINSHLELSSGILQTTDSARLIILDGATVSTGSFEAYIDGPILKQGSTNGSSFVFPTGDDGVYAPLEISPVTDNSFEYQAQYFSEPPPIEDGLESPISNVSGSGYWSIGKNTGADDVDVTLHWDDAAASGIENPDSLLVVGLTNNGLTNTWKSYGNGGTTGGTGSGVSGSITNANAEPPPLDEVTKLTLGSTSVGANALPVILGHFNANASKESVALNWMTIVEEDADYFIIERSINGYSFEEIGQVTAMGTQNGPQGYDFTDTAPLEGANYYRLKQVDYNGNYVYSPIVSAIIKSKITDFYAQPTLVEDLVELRGFTHQSGQIRLEIYSQTGIRVYQALHTIENGVLRLLTDQLNLNQAGIYHVVIYDGREIKSTRIIRGE